jgi:hypothetical protein
VVLTGEATVEAAVEAMKLGAREFLTKPISLKELDRLVRKAHETGQLRRENRRLEAGLRHQHKPPQIFGESAPMQALHEVSPLSDSFRKQCPHSKSAGHWPTYAVPVAGEVPHRGDGCRGATDVIHLRQFWGDLAVNAACVEAARGLVERSVRF